MFWHKLFRHLTYLHETNRSTYHFISIYCPFGAERNEPFIIMYIFAILIDILNKYERTDYTNSRTP